MSPGAILTWSFLVFFCAAAYDFAYGQYMSSNARRKSIRAGNWSVATYLIGLVGMGSVLQYSHWFIIAECLGLWVGSVVSTELEKIRDLD